MITGHTATYALLGDPVHHSLSPALHNAWFAHHGIDAVYVALTVPADATNLGDALRTLGLAGANLTVPHKGRVLASLDTVDRVARACGAVNTVWRDDAGLHGANTDADGFVRALVEAGGSADGATAVVLGAGGAGRAVTAGLAAHGAASVFVLNRTPRPLADVVDTFSQTRITSGALDDLPGLLSRADVVVNATSGGARTRIADLPVTGIRPGSWWCDLNYWDDDPPHIEDARERGAHTLTGHGMLLHQAALAFARFTGVSPDVAHGRAVLDGRG